MTDAIAILAEHVVRTDYANLSPEAVRAAKTFVLDAIGVGVAGSGGPWVDGLLAAAQEWGMGDESTVWVSGQRLPTPAAAMVNAYQIHNSEFDPVHEVAVVHPLAAVLSAAVAQAERQGGVGGRDLLLAVALGVDVACHIGVAARSPMRFFRPGTAGGFGATAAIAKLRGFDARVLIAALATVYSQMCGTMQAHTEGSTLLGLQIGFNARNAVVACDMAARGGPSLTAVLEGPFGYFHLFEGEHDLPTALVGLGRAWRIAELSHKPFPSGRATHGIVDGLLALRARHGFAPRSVERVRAWVPPLVHRLVSRPIKARLDTSYARLCAAYVGARALLRGTVELEDFRPAALEDPETHALAARFEIAVDGNPDPNALVPLAVGVTLQDGHAHEIGVEQMFGSPARPLSHEAHLAKFRRNWVSGARPLDPAQGEHLIALVDGIEGVADVRELVALMRVDDGSLYFR
jgi:aconitate decarboxylase